MQMIDELASIAASVGVPTKAFMSCMQYDDKCGQAARTEWGYGCTSTFALVEAAAWCEFHTTCETMG